MISLVNRHILLLITWMLIASCSSHQLELSTREPAGENSCADLMSALIQKNTALDTSPKEAPILPGPLVDVPLTRIISKRKSLKEKYIKITESIRDFQIGKDVPVNGKTKLLLDAREGYLAKIMMIRNAKKTIDLSYYIFKDDDTGKAILHELRLAIKRGVKVRILVDSSGSIAKAPFYDDIKALIALSGRAVLDEYGNPTGEYAHAEAMLFNPVFNIRAHVANWVKTIHNLFASENEKIPLATFTINRRSHDKILLIDAHSETDSMAIIGGRNIADRYYSVNSGEDNPILDAEILIKGLATKDENGNIQNSLEDHYNKIYFYLANKNFENFLFKTNRAQVKKEFKEMRVSAKNLFDEDGPLHEQLKQMEEDKFLETDFEDGLISIINEIQNLSRTKIFLAPQGAHNKKNGNSLVAKLHAEIAKAEDTVDIVSPYFWIPDEEIEFLIDWAKKHPHRKVRIFSNSITTTDNIIAQSMVDATFQETIIKRIKGTPYEKQFEIYSYGRIDDEILGGDKRYGFLHAKLVITDNKVVTVSTSNLDPISRHLNSEVGTTIENLPKNSKNLQKLVKYIDDLEKNSTLWGSAEWEEIRRHPNNRIMTILQAFVTKIIYALNLVPII
nr:phospholipase D-like domain-containing protein [Bacteriovorax sp. HI3]